MFFGAEWDKVCEKDKDAPWKNPEATLSITSLPVLASVLFVKFRFERDFFEMQPAGREMAPSHPPELPLMLSLPNRHNCEYRMDRKKGQAISKNFSPRGRYSPRETPMKC